MRARRYIAISFAITLAALCLGLVLRATTPLQVASNTWLAAGNMTTVRAGAASVLLPDGRIMITGGTDAAGNPVDTTEFFTADGAFTPGPSMTTPRAGHAAIWLVDGEVLVTGGITAAGAETNSAETYDPLTNAWKTLPSTLGSARTGHVAAQLEDGNVLLVGGENGGVPVSSVEIFTLVGEEFKFVGSLATPRKDAAAAVMPDGRALIAGGTGVVDGSDVVLDSTEIFTYNSDLVTGTITPGPNMAAARRGATATATYDGVAVIGGNDGTNDLATADIFSQWTNLFRTVAGATPRSKGLAVLLPNNGSILVTGGTAGKSVDLLQPWRNNKAGLFLATAPSSFDHTAGSVAPLGVGGLVLASGGNAVNGNTVELYGFPTIATDKSDYAPGTTVVMTGAGFHAGETITIHLDEWVSKTQTTYPDYTVTADANGGFTFSEYAPTPADLNSRYHLTAIGATSGLQAQTVFTDGNATSVSGTVRNSLGGLLIAGATVSCSAGCTGTLSTTTSADGSYYFDAAPGHGPKLAFSTNGPVTLSLTASLAGYANSTVQITISNRDTLTGLDITLTPSAVATNTTITSSANPSAYGQAVTFTATVTGSTNPSNVGTVTFVDGLTTLCSSVPLTGNTATCSPSPSSFGVGSHSVVANYSGTTTGTPQFSSSISTALGQTTNKADQTITVNTHALTTAAYNSSFTPLATATSNLPVAITVSGACSINGSGQVTITSGTGACTVFYDQAGNGNYNPAPQLSESTAAQKAGAAVTLADLTATYNGSPHAATATTTPAGLTVDFTYDGNATAPTNAGTYAVVATINDNNYHGTGNGSLVIDRAKAAITVTPYDVTYDGNAHTAVGTAKGVDDGDLSGLVVSGTTHTNAGDYTTDAWTFTDVTGNYNDASGTVHDKIAKANAVINVTPYDVTYDGNAHTALGTAKGVGGVDLGGLVVSGTTHTHAGDYTTDAWTFTDVTGNYNNATGTVHDKINKAPVTATAGSGSAMYDGMTKAPSACTITGAYTGDLSCVNSPASVGPDATSTPVMIAPMVSGTGLGNYDITLENGSYSITKANAVVDVTGYTGTYDGNAHGATGTAMGVEPTPVNLSSLLHLGATFTNVPGSTAHWTFDGNNNYNANAGDVAITINKAPITVAAGSYSDVYDGLAHSPTACAVTGTYTGGLKCVNNPTSVGPDVSSGDVKPVLAAAVLNNYDITLQNGSYSITKADAVVNVTGYTGNFDGQVHGASGTATGVEPTPVNLSSLLHLGATFTNVPGGTANWTFDGNNNYNAAAGDVAIIINKAPITVAAGSYSGVYDGLAHSPTACAVTGTYTGGLKCVNNPTSVGPDVSSGDVKPVLAAAVLNNYDITLQNGSYSITKATAVVTVNPYNVIYDGAAHTATGKATGVNATDLSAYLNLSGTTHTAVGDYSDSWSFSGATNYNDASGTVNDVIRPWTLTGFYQPVNMNAKNTVKGGSTVPLKFNIYQGTTERKDVAGIKSFTLAPANCTALSLLADDPVDFTTTGGTSLRYDTTAGQFIQNWQTPRGQGCVAVVMTTQDGSTITAYFQMK